MIRILFTATRALDGHGIGDPVTLTFSPADLTPGRRLTRDVQKALSGRRETLLHNGLRTWAVTTEPLSGAQLDAFEEFLTAVEDGSSFDFEPFYNTTPADPSASETRLRLAPTVRCVLDSESYDLTRLIGDGTGGKTDWYQVSFMVSESP